LGSDASARAATLQRQSPFAPAPIDEVVVTIRSQRPDLVFAPHVETGSGMMLPDDYLRAVTTSTSLACDLREWLQIMESLRRRRPRPNMRRKARTSARSASALFGLDELHHVERTVRHLEDALNGIV
jgi:hypothetical protein